jgi:16S rRNA (uracil1498-N3)-methyltransferase
MKTSNKAPRFFIEKKLDQQEILIQDKNIIHQLQKVLRKKTNDEIVLLDGNGKEFFGTIKEISKKEIIINRDKITIHESEKYETDDKNILNTNKVILAPSILKKDNFELVIQKCTELGIKNIQPIISERTEKDNLNFERLEKISTEASEQSEKIFLSKIYPTENINKFFKKKSQSKNTKIFALQFDSPKFNKNSILENSSTDSIEEIIFLVGPEGGWGEVDLELFEKFGVEKISLGKQILRSETASISISALLLL